VSNVVITACYISTDQSQGSLALPCNICYEAASQRDMDSIATLDTSKTFLRDSLGGGNRLHHSVAKRDFVAKIEVCLHKEEGAQFINVDDPSLLLQNHLEPRLPALGETNW